MQWLNRQKIPEDYFMRCKNRILGLLQKAQAAAGNLTGRLQWEILHRLQWQGQLLESAFTAVGGERPEEGARGCKNCRNGMSKKSRRKYFPDRSSGSGAVDGAGEAGP